MDIKRQIHKLAYIREFEGLRGFLAWWVVLDHMCWFAGYVPTDPSTPLWAKFLMFGNIRVSIFNILSGFVLCFLLDKEAGTRYTTFLAARFFRLFPVYWFLLFAAVMFLPIADFSQTAGHWMEPREAANISERLASISSNLGEHVMLHTVMLHGLVPDQVLPHSGDALIAAAWSLSLEWQFCLVAPFIFWLSMRRFWLAVAIGVGIASARLITQKMGLTFSYGAFLPLQFEYFGLGMGSYFTYKRFCANGQLWREMSILCGFVALAFVVMIFTGGLFNHFFAVALWLLCLFAAMSRVSGADHLKWMCNFLVSAPMAFIGRISYSTYLCHQIILWISGYLMLTYLGPELSKLQAFYWVVLLGGGLTLLASILLYYAFELPGIRVGRWVRNRGVKVKQPAAVGAG